MRNFGFIATLLLGLFTVSAVQALDITLNKNGYAPTSNGQLTGTSITAQPLGVTNASTLFTGLVANGTYSLDFFHNSGTGGSDFTFIVNPAGTGIQTVNLGGSVHNMVVGFTPGDSTLTLNTGTIVYNANLGQRGNHTVQGLYANSGVNAPAPPRTAIPGIYSVDNLYNSGAGNEDFQFQVSDTFQTSAMTGTSGPAPGIPRSEYATFTGNQVNIRSEMVHFIVETNTSMAGLLGTQPLLNEVVTMGGTRREFDMLLPIGAAGINFSSFGAFSIDSSTAALANGNIYSNANYVALRGAAALNNDFHFLPTLRYDGTSNGTGFYWLGPGPGIENEVTATVTGFFDGNVNPLTLTVTAILPAYVAPPIPAPEPTTLALLGLGMATVAMRRRKRS